MKWRTLSQEAKKQKHLLSRQKHVFSQSTTPFACALDMKVVPSLYVL